MLLTLLFWAASQAPFPAADSVVRPSPVLIRSVTLRGNHHTHDRIIRREMDLHVGDTVKAGTLAGKLLWDERKINNTNLFVTVSVTAKTDSLPQPPGQAVLVDVEVDLRERWYWFVYPVFDLADRNFNEWWYERGHDLRRTIYGLRLSNRNLTGNADRLNLVLESGFTQRVVLAYSWPYLNKAQTTGLRMEGSYATNRDIPFRTFQDKWEYARSEQLLRTRSYATLTLTHRQGFYQFHTLNVGINHNTIADTVASLNPDYFGNSRTSQRFLQLSYSYTYDRRDNVAYPLRGILFSATLSRYGLLPPDGLQATDLSASVSRYWPLGGRWFAGSNLRGFLLQANQLPYANLRGIGLGQDVVRGYELYVVNGQQGGILKNSLRFQLFSIVKQLRWLKVRQFNTVPLSAYLNLYADAGYINSTVAEQYQSRLANRMLYGGGVGLDLVTFYNAVLRFNYSINRAGERGFFFNIARDL